MNDMNERFQNSLHDDAEVISDLDDWVLKAGIMSTLVFDMDDCFRQVILDVSSFVQTQKQKE